MAEMDKQTSEFDLDDLFAQARERDTEPAPDFMARVLEDALAAQPAPVSVAPARPRTSRLRQFLTAIGGWPAMAGLATAGVAGLWFGINPPDAVVYTAETVLGVESDTYLVDLMPGYDFAMVEG